MPRVYGISNHTPQNVIDKYKLNIKDVSVLPLNTILSKDKDYSKTVKKYVMILNSKDFNRNVEVFNNVLNDRIFFVFTSPISVFRYENIPVIDSKRSKDSSVFMFKLTELPETLDLTTSNNKIHLIKENNYISAIVDSTKKFCSIMNSLMTFIYTLPSSSHQKPVKTALCNWIYSSGSDKDLDYLLGRINTNASLTGKQEEKIRKILLSDIGKRYRDAFSEYTSSLVNGKPKPIAKLAVTHEISAYDMRYIKAIVDSSEKYSDLEKITLKEYIEYRKKKGEPIKGLQEK